MPAEATPEKTSALLHDLLANLEGPKVTIGAVLGGLGRRSYGGVMVIVAALGLLPGIAIVAGMVMMILGVQMLWGLKVPRLGRLISDRELETRLLREIGGKWVNRIATVEKWVEPRWLALSVPAFTRLLGLVTIALGFVVMLPLPATNLLPCVALLLLSVGELERDGVLIVAGLSIAIAALFVGSFFAMFALTSMQAFLGQL